MIFLNDEMLKMLLRTKLRHVFFLICLNFYFEFQDGKTPRLKPGFDKLRFGQVAMMVMWWSTA